MSGGCKKFFFEYSNETDIIRIRIENQIQRRLIELDRVSSSKFITLWKLKIRDLEKFSSKIFFSTIQMKLILYECWSHTDFNEGILSSIEQVLVILSNFEVLNSLWSRPCSRSLSSKKFFLNIEIKRISFETESKTKFNTAYLSSIESVVPILSYFENWKSET